MTSAVSQALHHLDSRAQGFATRNTAGRSGGDGGKIINGFPVVRPGSKLEAQMRKEAAELDAINRATRLRFFGEEYQEPVQLPPREIVPPPRKTAPRKRERRAPLPTVPVDEQQRIRALVIAAADTQGFHRALRKVMCWDWGNWTRFLAAKTATKPQTWARLEAVVPQILAELATHGPVRPGRKAKSRTAAPEEVAEVRAMLDAVTKPYGFWTHLRKLAHICSGTAWSLGGEGRSPAKSAISVEQLNRVRGVLASGAVMDACAAMSAGRSERMRIKRAADRLAKEAQTTV